MIYIPNNFKDGEVFYAKDVNKIENQLEILTNLISDITALNNIWVTYEPNDDPPPNKDMLWVDLSDSADNVLGDIDAIIQEQNIVINNLSEQIKIIQNQIFEIITNGGIVTPPDNDFDSNNYLLLENGLMLLTEDGKPLLCENDFIEQDSIIIKNALLIEDNNPLMTEDGKVLLLG